MSESFIIGDPPITIRLRRSTRARRLSLRISNKDGSVSLTVPRRASVRSALAFANDQQDWLRQNLARQPDQISLGFGGAVMLDGQAVRVVQGVGRGIHLVNGQLEVPGHEAEVGARLRGYLKTYARDQLAQASESYAKLLDVRISKITLRDTRSRWGSCTAQGNLMYSWRLAMAPKSVRDYVAAHEVCHLRELNHSPAYWALVAQVVPDYRDRRDWLREHGASLHRYRF